MPTADVVIMGGGVIGLSTAYHLARKQAGRIVLLEKGPLGDGSSSRAAGITSNLMWTETGVAARQVGAKLFRELSEELEGYTYYNEHGCLNTYTPTQWANYQRVLPIYDRLEAPYEVLDAVEMRSRWPALTPDEHTVGILDPQGGYSEPPEYIAALSRRIRELGVEVREGEKVVDWQMGEGRVRGVCTESEVFAAEAVVCTVHAWGSKLLGRLGWKIPVKYFVHQRYVTAPINEPLHWPPVNANSQDAYFRPASGNRILVGTSSPDRAEHRVESLDFHMSELSTPTTVRDAAANRLAALLPALKNTTWESERVGLLGFSMDEEPILGAVDRLPGLFVGASFHSGGFSYNPVAGLLLAECVLDGHTCVDISGFSPNRFQDAEVDAYLTTTLDERDINNRRH